MVFFSKIAQILLLEIHTISRINKIRTGLT